MSKTKCKGSIEKENVVQAVVVMDTFNKNLFPACTTPAFLHLVNEEMIRYILKWLSLSGVQEALLFCSSSFNAIKSYVENVNNIDISIKVLACEGSNSLGDIMRALDRQAIIRNNFILLSANTIGNVNLIPLVEKFKRIQNSDKGASMMLVYREVHSVDRIYDNSFIVLNEMQRILYHQQTLKGKKVKLPLDILLDNGVIDVRSDVVYSGLAVCSLAVPPLFSDNFDFQTESDLIREMLTNEDVLSNTLYCHVLSDTHYVAQVKDWPSYQHISYDIIQRSMYPIVPDASIDCIFRINNVYIGNAVKIARSCRLGFDVVIGDGSSLDHNTYVDKSVVGKHCTIGKNVVIDNSFVFDNVSVGDNCKIKHSVISDGCILEGYNVVDSGSIIGPKVVVRRKDNMSNMVSVLESGSEGEKLRIRKYSSAGDSDSEEDESEVPPGLQYENKFETNFLSTSDDSSDEETVSSRNMSPILDDVNIFFNEVVDSLSRGYEDQLNCQNLILEINSSRYAYNISMNEVNFHLVRAILTVKLKNEAKSTAHAFLQNTITKLKYFMPLLKNYIKNEAANSDCLLAVEDIAVHDEMLFAVLSKVLEFLYDEDIISEETILKWFSNLTDDDIKRTVTPFIDWLNEADEESDDEDEND